MNNIFDFATKELSQDAVLCWILNWVNYPNSRLYGLGYDLLTAINGTKIPDGEQIQVLQQKENADIVVVIPSERKIIIIEDKVYSSEHDNQIEKYRKVFSRIEKQKDVLGIKTEKPYQVSTVYLKTGYFYDNDKLVQVDIIIDGQKLYKIVSNAVFRGESEVLDSYVSYLKRLLDWYNKFEDVTGRYEDGGYHISWEGFTQFKMMRFIFPESMWDGISNVYKVENGSSSGRPWTELSIVPDTCYKDSNDRFSLFWRIDTAKKGPYLSLRFYESFDKQDKDKAGRHNECYTKLKAICERTIKKENSIGILWDDVNDGYRGNYKEASLFTIYLAKYLDKWDEIGDEFAEYIRSVTKEIVSGFDSVEL